MNSFIKKREDLANEIFEKIKYLDDSFIPTRNENACFLKKYEVEYEDKFYLESGYTYLIDMSINTKLFMVGHDVDSGDLLLVFEEKSYIDSIDDYYYEYYSIPAVEFIKLIYGKKDIKITM